MTQPQTIASIEFKTRKSAVAGAERAGLFSVRIEKIGPFFHITEGALQPQGPDVTHNDTTPHVAPGAVKVAPVAPAKAPKTDGACAIVRRFTRDNPDLSREQVVEAMVAQGIQKGTAAIQFGKVKRGIV
jgi:hypothetical protein